MADGLTEQAKRALEQLEAFRIKWRPILRKQIAKTFDTEAELVAEPLQEAQAVNKETSEEAGDSAKMEIGDDSSSVSMDVPEERPECSQQPETPELSVTAQYVIAENVNKLKQILQDMLNEHRHIHSAVSKCGKDLDRTFQVDLKDLIKNEKNIEASPEYLAKANHLIFDHLMSLGRIDVAETFMQESEMSLDVPPLYDVDTMRSIMEPFKNRQFLPAIEWIKENAPEHDDLLFRLHRQHIVQLLLDGQRLEALKHARELQPFAKNFSVEFTQIMTAIVSYPTHLERYKNLFHEDIWLNLEADLAAAISDFRSPLRTVLNTGARAVPMLLTLRAIMNKRPNHFLLGDELPIEVPVQRVHSSFTCPILKTQSTDSNPPMRLTCGHVISREALNKLAQNLRNTRLKCPYCPEESMVSEAKRVYF